MPRTHNTTYTFKMPAKNVTVSATFELAIKSIAVAPETATDVVLNKSAAEQKVKMTATAKDADGADLDEAASAVTWSVEAGETGVTIDQATGELTIPANKTGKVTVTATSKIATEPAITGTAVIRIDDDLVSTDPETKKTTIYVAADTAVITNTSSYTPFELRSGEQMTGDANGKMDGFTELVVTRASSNNNYDYRTTPMLDFDLSDANLSDLLSKAYSAELVVPGATGYEGTNREREPKNTATIIDAWEPGATSVSGTIKALDDILTPQFKYTVSSSPADISAQKAKINILAALKEDANIKNNHLYVSIGEKETGYRTSIMSRENMTDGNRGAYIEVQEGIELSVKYTDKESKPVTGLEVTVTGDADFSETVTTGDDGVAKVIVPYAKTGTYTFATSIGKYNASNTEVQINEGTAAQGNAQLTDNENPPATLKISYRTTATEKGTEVKSETITLTPQQSFVNQEITLDAKYLGTQLVETDDSTGKYYAYTVKTGIDGGKVKLAKTAEEGKLEVEDKDGTWENTAIVVVDDTDKTEYYYYEDFSGLTTETLAADSWEQHGGTSSISTDYTDATNFLNLYCTGDEAVERALTLGTDASENLTVSYDALIASGQRSSELTLYSGNKTYFSGNSKYGIDQGSILKINLADKNDTVATVNDIALTKDTNSLKANMWFHVDADLDFTTHMAKVTVKSYDLATTYYEGNVKMGDQTATGITGIYYRISKSTGKLDNIKIKKFDGSVEAE